VTAEELRAELAAAEAALVRPSSSGDPALARLGPVALRQHHARTDRDLERYTAAVARVEALRHRLALAVERERVPLTAVDVAGAREVRTRSGWWRVVRVNARSVSVESGFSWVDRVPFGRVLEVRR
jgi:hypothetical protein